MPISQKVAEIDIQRMERERSSYEDWLDGRIDEAYNFALEAKEKGLDFSDSIEIPRASDLASRTEKLLEDPYLYTDPVRRDKPPLRIEGQLRDLLSSHDRETAAIMIAVSVTKEMHSRTGDRRRAIDSGLRVGLAVLTEAVLVAPLDGIGEVRIMNNSDGSEFLSIDFCGPIRAAGGTAQALGVLIGDILRREMGIGRYLPTVPEVERVKEEFGLYRMNLQYKPPPEETDLIVNACPVMINGEETERMECAGYKEVRNIVNENGSYRTRVRGGVMLVIGEGLCLKAPKIQTHTERLSVPGWEFISKFAEKKEGSDSNGFESKRRVIPKESRYMGDVIAGRPVFGEPREPGGFRLRYGRSRATGLAAAGLNPVTMEAMGGFLSVGTQMKIEGPGKACAVTPCIDIDGPKILLNDGSFLEVRTNEEWEEHKENVDCIWDSGEILLGYGEFLENNKTLVPSSYSIDWWAADVAESIDSQEKVEFFSEIIGIPRIEMPEGLPFNGAIKRGGEDPLERSWRRRDWISYLKGLVPNWGQLCAICEKFGTALPPPWNLWWSDLPIQFLPKLAEYILEEGGIEGSSLRVRGVVEGWPFSLDNETLGIGTPVMGEWPRWTEVNRHGLVKSSLMTLGLSHYHEGVDIVVPSHWEALVDGLGLEVSQNQFRMRFDSSSLVSEITERISANREGLQREKDSGGLSEEARRMRAKLDDYKVERSLQVVRKASQLPRWEDAVPCRIGSRMGRPEKSGIREMNPRVHAIFPIGESGGPQRLVSEASSRGVIRVDVGPRVCQSCGRQTPHLTCHHRPDPKQPVACGGRTSSSPRKRRGRRKGERTAIELAPILEVKRRSLGLDRLPEKIKAVKGLFSENQTPEPLEKGILRALHGVSVFRDGTSRFDMSDVPVTHFRPSEIGTRWKRLVQLGYTHDVRGAPLKNDSQILELLPQDFIPSSLASQHLLSTCNFLDDLLVRFYGTSPFYSAKSPEDIVGHIAIGLAPHTSGGVACRIIGWTNASAGYAHPLFHAAKRRNCDGDEDSIMMLMDGLLNFTQSILPANRGGRMDAPLVLTTRLNPSEIDKEALNVDCSWDYSRDFFEATLEQPHSKEVRNLVDIVEGRLGMIGEIRGYGWTHDSGPLDAGPRNSSYKTLVTMKDKLDSQLELGRVLRPVGVRGVAKQVIESHFLPDMRGNLMAYTRQKVRCVKCGESYRRVPLAGKCIKKDVGGSGAFSTSGGDGSTCGGNVILTVSKGNVEKYIQITEEVMDHYGVDDYTKHRVGWMSSSVDSLFNNDRVTVMTLEDFI
ncbi:MAG: DNA polymerase II large subunit [Euryarchaeota archaeon]|nr:DNA polymerase II large subunit [Euryarchaeota archaeon]